MNIPEKIWNAVSDPSWDPHTVRGTWTIVISIIIVVAVGFLIVRVALPAKRPHLKRSQTIVRPQADDHAYVLDRGGARIPSQIVAAAVAAEPK